MRVLRQPPNARGDTRAPSRGGSRRGPAGDQARALPLPVRFQRARPRNSGRSQELMHDRAFTTSMPKPEIMVLIPESTRKARGGSADSPEVDSIAASLPATARAKLEGLREEVLHKSPQGSVRAGGLLPAYRRVQGNMYVSIPDEAWAKRAPGVEIIIASGLRGLVAARDTLPSYALSTAAAPS